LNSFANKYIFIVMENSKSIVEHGVPKPEKMKIIKVMRGTSFLNYRDGLEKQGMKVEFATSPFPYYRITHRKWGKNSAGKERAIYITNKKNAGDDAEYISNDNIAMGELTEIVQETMFNKMKAKEELRELVREVVSEIVTENHKFKVGDEVKFNGNYDGVVVKVHTSGKLKGMIDVQKKGRTSTVTLSANDEREVRLAEAITEEMHDCIQDYMEVHGLSYSEAMKKCRGSVWDEKGGKRGKRGKRMRREDISEDEGANINVHALSRTEIQLAIGAINFFGTGQHPFADEKGLKYFKVDYLADIIAKNKNKLEATARKHLEKLVKKLQKATNEETINEGDDLRFVIDQLSNSMEHYDEKEFVDHMSKETNYDANNLKKVFKAYWKLGAMDRFNMATDINKTKKFLAKLGIK
jgi:hypothetical protein